jgi:hypothetical protein
VSSTYRTNAKFLLTKRFHLRNLSGLWGVESEISVKKTEFSRRSPGRVPGFFCVLF